MHAGQPTAPIGKLQGNRNLARIEVAVGTKNVGSNLSRDFAETGDVSWRTGGITFHLGAVLADQIRQRIHIPVKNPGESGTSRPVRDRLLVEPWSGLVRRVPRAPRTRQRQVANVAGDLFTLECGQAMEARAVNNAGVGEVEVFQVAPIPGVTVRTARLNPGTIGEAVCREGGGLPEFAPSPNRGGIRQGRSPGFGRILHKIVWREELAS